MAPREHLLQANGLHYLVHPDVYDPSDDTWLLLRALRHVPPGAMLELGTGTGLVAIQAARDGRRVVATDVNPDALRLARANAGRNQAHVKLVRADLLRGLHAEAFDAIVFNPPYLPTEEGEHVPGPLDRAFDGGPDGLSITRRFLHALPDHAPDVFLVTTTLQDAGAWAALVHATGRPLQVVEEAALPHETLRVVRLARPTQKD